MQKPVILCVDDEPIVLKGLEAQLGRTFGKDYILEFAENGEEALEIIDDILKKGGLFPLIISDQLMPGLKGNELLKKIHEISQKTLKILLTGQADAAAIGDAVNSANLYRYIAKPWETDDLVLTVTEALRSFFQDQKLEEQNQLLKEYNEQLEAKVEERTAEIMRQKIELQDANKNITASISYASLIQQAMIPSVKILEKHIPKYFILNKPKDIVSGDFYWFKQIKNHIYIAVADCTGHGVPGAFMSMLGISQLNEIIIEKDINPANEILNELRKRIKSSLHQDGQKGHPQDGMDIAFCVIDIENKTLQFSGANSPLYLFSKKNANNSYELIETKPDRMPIGVHPSDNLGFTNNLLNLQNEDAIYIFSDGYVSQFGGENNDKFKVKRFQDILTRMQDKPMIVQKQILEETIIEWQGKQKQTDDILVIGIKF